ncbi:MAG: oxamate carbamoyltransferase subunit AllH family protein, partial [Actinomycetes bacterium]
TAATAATAATQELVGPAARLLGLGPGLTPSGDDMLAGAIVTLLRLGSATPGVSPQLRVVAAMADELAAQAPGRTTEVSALLLGEAAAGQCCDELGEVVGCVATASCGLPAALTRLLAVGHRSGPDMARGVLTGLEALLAWTTPRRKPADLRSTPAAPPSTRVEEVLR